MDSALAGVKVLSMAWQYPGPYCSMLLADMGANVIMLEPPGIGDPSRLMPCFFSAINRNKRSITLNLATEKGREVCHRLAQSSDVVTEGFRPGIAERLGVDYHSLKQVNPRLIYASISGYGQDGPYRDWPAHDLSYQGVAGMLAAQISAKGTSLTPPPVAIADLSSAMFTALAILAALYAREKTGKGQYIDVSMTDGLVSWMSVPLTCYLQQGEAGLRGMPGYGIFETKDGRFVTLSMTYEDHFWRNLCTVIGKQDLGQLSREERSAKQQELVSLLRAVFLTKTRDEWLKLLISADVPCGPAYELAEVITDPQLRHRGMFVELDDPRKGKRTFVAPSLKFSDTPAGIRMPPPELGEHTEEILLSLGYSQHQIEEMRHEGVV